MNILFLYTELGGYTLNCMQKAIETHPDLSISVVRWPLVNEAPFDFNFEGIKVYERKDYNYNSLVELVISNNIQTIICSGWVDKEYVKVCQKFKNKIPTVLALDNQWEGNLKQYLAKFLSPFLIRNKFSHAWVPGKLQAKFAHQLGFSKARISEGFYVANTDLFQGYYTEFKTQKENKIPKRFLYVGRYIKHKGIYDMWNAFIKLQEETESEWELWCVGAGEEYENRVEHPKIKHFGFLQPDQFAQVIKGTSVYILPSHFEPWGVSVQEFAAAGFPMLLSSKIGSKELFFKEEVNGFSFKATNQEEILSSFRKMISLSEKEMINMQYQSNKLSLQISTKNWAKTLTSFKL